MKSLGTQTTPKRAHQDALMTQHLDVARRIALKVSRRCPEWMSAEDLISAATLGLAEAARRYDESRGEPFLGFAEKRIRGAVLDELRRGDIMPRRVRQKARQIARIVESLEHQLGRKPRDEEIAAELGVSMDKYRDGLQQLADVQVTPLDLAGEQVSDRPSAFEEAEQREMARLVRDGLELLGEREQTILNLYYVEKLTYAEIGEILGVTASRVCQLRSRAIGQLRAAVHGERQAA